MQYFMCEVLSVTNSLLKKVGSSISLLFKEIHELGRLAGGSFRLGVGTLNGKELLCLIMIMFWFLIFPSCPRILSLPSSTIWGGGVILKTTLILWPLRTHTFLLVSLLVIVNSRQLSWFSLVSKIDEPPLK